MAPSCVEINLDAIEQMQLRGRRRVDGVFHTGREYKRDGSVARGPAPRPLKLAKVGTDDKGQVVLEKWTDQDFRENV